MTTQSESLAPEPLGNETYLGDAVYAGVNHAGDIVVYTSDGLRATNTIYFEPDVLAMFLQFIREKVMRAGE